MTYSGYRPSQQTADVVAVNENIKLLTRERDSFKSKLNEEIKAHENLLKETKELKDSMAKERDSLKREIDDEIIVREDLLKDIRELAYSRAKERDSLKSKLDDEIRVQEYLVKKIRELEDSQENHVKKIRQLDDSRAKERESHNSELDKLRVELTQEKDNTSNKIKLLAKERDSLKSELDDRITAYENLQFRLKGSELKIVHNKEDLKNILM